jgi:hypothetical protein
MALPDRDIARHVPEPPDIAPEPDPDPDLYPQRPRPRGAYVTPGLLPLFGPLVHLPRHQVAASPSERVGTRRYVQPPPTRGPR